MFIHNNSTPPNLMTMKLNKLATLAAVLLASLTGARANTLASWTFDNLSTGNNSTPATVAGSGGASVVGLTGVASPSIVALSGSSTGSAGPNSWQIPAGSGWSTNAAIGTQGVQFNVSTFGFYQVQVSFDVNATANAEGALQVQYTTEGTTWHNATVTSVGVGATILNNSVTTNSLVVGNYVQLSSGWNNQITVNLSGVSAVDNNPNFGIRIVNAATGTNDLDTTGALYVSGNATASWTFDNVVVQGVSFDTVADWTFDNDASLTAPVNQAPPAISNNTCSATIMGFNLPNTTFANLVTGSTNYGDIVSTTPYSSTPASPYAWRLRGQNPGNGWISTQPIGSQGAEFDVSTLNYSNVLVTFDLYFTTQGEAKMCVLYTTNGWTTTNVANNLSYGAGLQYIYTNTTSPNTVAGTYFYNTYGSIFFNNLVIDFTGVPGVDNNPNFGFRIVNAATGFDCVNYLGQPYNNSSGNGRLDNVAVSGQFEGQYAPTITNAPYATVDHPFTNTFASNPAWASGITSVYVNGSLVTNAAYVATATNIVFNPAKSTVLQVSGTNNIVIYSAGYTSAKYTQVVQTGVATKLTYTQLAGPSGSGGTLTVQPAFAITDQYGNGTTNPYAGFTVTAYVSNSVAWTLGGSTNQTIVNGFCVFTDLTATVTGSSAVSGAAIKFVLSGYTNSPAPIYSTNFTIGAPAVPFTPGNLAILQQDAVGNNNTFSIIEVRPSVAGQTAPINLLPISATGTNGMREAASGTAGKLTMSDDGTHLIFAAYNDNSSATPDETMNLNRCVGIVSNNLAVAKPLTYVSTSVGGSQARAACSPDNYDFLVCDKGGLYVNSTLVYQQNNLSARSFGGVAWVQTAKVAIPPTPSVYVFDNASDLGNGIDWGSPIDNGPVINQTFTPPSDLFAQDFYMVASNGTYCTMYTVDQSAGAGQTNGILSKWLLLSDGYTWTNSGNWTNLDNFETVFAATNGNGGVNIYYANGTGSKTANSVILLVDSNVYGPLNLVYTNTIYTASKSTAVFGLTFTPQSAANAITPTLPPVLTPQSGLITGNQILIKALPDDPNWRSAITTITVNGTALPTSAYNLTTNGQVVLYPSQSTLLQTNGSKAIVITATGYSTNYLTQSVFNAASTITITTQPTAPLYDGGALATQPVITVKDIYGNPVVTNVIAAPVQGTWTLGGTTNISSTAGTATFSGLTAYGNSAVTGATIKFTAGSLSATSSAFNLAAPLPAKQYNARTLAGGKFALTFSNYSGLSFSVLSTNNLTIPVTNWPVIGHPVESSTGIYQFTNSAATTNSPTFFIIREP